MPDWRNKGRVPELTARSQELGGTVVKSPAIGGMTRVKGLAAKAPTGGIGKKPTKSFHGGKKLVFDTDHARGHQLQVTSVPG